MTGWVESIAPYAACAGSLVVCVFADQSWESGGRDSGNCHSAGIYATVAICP
jgi:hypothetical protein